MAEERIYDSPTGWVARHIEDYVRTDGARGHRWHGADTLLLVTRGRKSGKLRRSALIYGQSGEHFVVVASRGGAAHHPQWYLNLSEDPEVSIQVGAQTFPARARTTEGTERESLWEMMARIWPAYDSYQARTDRQIPVVVLTPAKSL